MMLESKDCIFSSEVGRCSKIVDRSDCSEKSGLEIELCWPLELLHTLLIHLR